MTNKVMISESVSPGCSDAIDYVDCQRLHLLKRLHDWARRRREEQGIIASPSPAASCLHGGPGMTQSANLQSDQDLKKGAVEDGPNTHGNQNAQAALDESGLPLDDVAIAQDVLGANEDETQG